MKHPDRDKWVPFLFGEAEPEIKKELADHLKACPDCAEELHGWRESLHQLDAWKMPRQSRRLIPRVNPVLNFAAAAIMMLGIGFGAGKWVSPSIDKQQIQASVESSLRTRLLPELRQEIRQELVAEWQTQLAQLRNESQKAIAGATAEAVSLSAGETERVLEQLLALIESNRAEDQSALAELAANLRKQHETDFVSLRKDLETVASTSDDRILAAQLKLIELTALNPNLEH